MVTTGAYNLKKYFIFTYIIFWILLGLTGFLIFLDIPVAVQNIMKNVSAASPTFAVIILFRKLYPNLSFKDYFKLHFRKKTTAGNFILPLLIQAAILVMVILSYFIITNRPITSIAFIAPSAVIPVLIMDLTSGALGEELGWRGLALNRLQRRFSPLAAGLVVGLVWGFWHLPLMILSGYEGMELVSYIFAFMVAVISLSVLITFFYNKSKNILVAMWMHFWFNFLLKIVIIDIFPLLIGMAAGYLLVAVLVVVLNKNEMLERGRV